MAQVPMGFCSVHGDVRLIAGKCSLCLEFPEGVPHPAGWPMDPTSSRLRGEEFVKDWDRMIAAVADFSDKWNLPKAEMTFHLKVHAVMNAVADQRILGTLIYRDVKVRFGRFEQGTIFRES